MCIASQRKYSKTGYLKKAPIFLRSCRLAIGYKEGIAKIGRRRTRAILVGLLFASLERSNLPHEVRQGHRQVGVIKTA